MALSETGAARGRTEIYGESESRAVFSAEFSVAPERAAALARAELRIAPIARVRSRHVNALPAAGKILLPASSVLAYTAAIAGAATRAAKFANLLPAERRASHDRLQYLVPAILAVLLVLGLVAVFAIFPAVEQRRYRADLDRAARQLEPSVLRVQTLEKRSQFPVGTENPGAGCGRSAQQTDLDVLNEIDRACCRLPLVWTSAIKIYRDSVVISGEADQAAPLLKALDSSPLFQNSEFALSVSRSAERAVSHQNGAAGQSRENHAVNVPLTALSQRDRRALVLLAVGLVVAAVLRCVSDNAATVSVASPRVSGDGVRWPNSDWFACGESRQPHNRHVRRRRTASDLADREARHYPGGYRATGPGRSASRLPALSERKTRSTFAAETSARPKRSASTAWFTRPSRLNAAPSSLCSSPTCRANRNWQCRPKNGSRPRIRRKRR